MFGVCLVLCVKMILVVLMVLLEVIFRVLSVLSLFVIIYLVLLRSRVFINAVSERLGSRWMVIELII